MSVDETLMCSFKKIKPNDKKKFGIGASGAKKFGNSSSGKKFGGMAKFSR